MLKFRRETQETAAPYSSSASAQDVRPTTYEAASGEAMPEAAPFVVLEPTVEAKGRMPSVCGIPLARKDLFGIGTLCHRVRRTTIRRRPYRWTRGRKAALFSLGLLSVVGMRWYGANQTPLDTYPLPSPANMGIPISDAKLRAPNASSFYQIAADTLPPEVGVNVENILFQPGGPPLTELRPLMAEVTPALNRLREGFAYEYHGLQTNYLARQLTTPGLNTPAASFMMQRQMARLLLAESYLRSLDGNRAGALSSAIDDIRYGQDIGKGYSLIQSMIGILVENIGNGQALALTDGLTASEARAASARVATLVKHERPFDQIIEGERASGNAVIREFFSQPNYNSLMSDMGLYSENIWNNLAQNVVYKASLFWYGKQGILDAYNRHMLEVAQRTRLPLQKAKAKREETLPPVPYFASVLIPNLQRAHLSHTRMLARNRVLLAQLAVQAYRAEHGGILPQSLAELTVGPNPYLDAVPLDPFSSDGEATLRYKNGKVYSVGENAQDDGGSGDDRLDVETFLVPPKR